MTIDTLIESLQALRRGGVPGDAPILVEGYDEEDRFVQAVVSDATTETRCEEEHEPPGVYLTLDELVIDE
jgi:hypothetical protein